MQQIQYGQEQLNRQAEQMSEMQRTMNALLAQMGPGGGFPPQMGHGGGRNPSSNLKVQFEQVYKGERKDNLD